MPLDDPYLLRALTALLEPDALAALRAVDRRRWTQIPVRRVWHGRARERLRALHTPTVPFRIRARQTDTGGESPPVHPCAHHDCRRNVLCCVDMRFDPPLAYRTSVPYCAVHMREHHAELLRWIHEC